MTHLTVDTDLPTFWFWMFITGVGIGPSMAAFTIIVQNAVAFDKLGVATSNLTFFRQIGGSIGLAIAGTVFGQSLKDLLPGKIQPVFADIAASIPEPFRAQFAQLGSGAGAAKVDLGSVSGVGQSFGKAIAGAARSGAPEQAKAFVDQIFTPAVVGRLDHAFFDAFSLAVGQTFQIAVVTTAVAVLAVVALRELPLRKTFGPRAAAPAGAGSADAGAGADGAEAAPPVPAMH